MRNSSHLTHPEKHYRKMVKRADLLSDVIGSSKKHPLLNLFELTSELIRAYDLERFDVPDTKPWELLSFLMEEHGLKQSDLPELGNQSVVSQILSGTRDLNVRQINSLGNALRYRQAYFLSAPINQAFA